MNAKPTLLVVEDSAENRTVLVQILKDLYQLRIAVNGEQALTSIASKAPDLILLDIVMPGIDGYEVCQRIKANPATADIPVIFLTASSDVDSEQRGFALGAVDFIFKPVSPPILLARVRNHLLLHNTLDTLKLQNEILDHKVTERTLELEQTRDALSIALASICETRDSDTGLHIRRTQTYVELLARTLQPLPDFSVLLTEANINLMAKSAALHDIGKVGIPDAILLKPGKLTVDEFEIMKTHTLLGRDCIAAAESCLSQNSIFLQFAREIAHYHQEKWDGSGYPDALVGDAIPLAARLMAVADVYDALRVERVYKKPFSHETAIEILVAGRGNHFDPRIVDAFLQINQEFNQISIDLKD